jgi:hypothetical protein
MTTHYLEFKKNQPCAHQQTGDLFPCTIVDIYITEKELKELGYGWINVVNNKYSIKEAKLKYMDFYFSKGFDLIAERVFENK